MSTTDKENEIPLQHYVYELIDTSTNPHSTFYVGEGTGRRIHDHVRDVLNKIDSGIPLTEAKELRIASFYDAHSGKHPDQLKALVIGRWRTEAEVRAVEATLIKWVYPQDQLTNINEGHNANNIRGNGDLARDENLDTKGFTKERGDAMRVANVQERADVLKKLMQKLGFENLDKATFNNMEYALYWPVPNFPVEVQIKLQTGSYKVVLNARPSLQRHRGGNGYKENHASYVALMKQAGYLISAEADAAKSFAPCFDSTQKGRKGLNTAGTDLAKSICGESVELYCFIDNGIDETNVEWITSALRDLQIRLTMADAVMNAPDTIAPELFKSLLMLFQSKPGTKWFRRDEVRKFLMNV